MKSRVKKQLRNRKRRLQHRLRQRQRQERKRRLFQDQNIHYQYTEKVRAGRFGGLGVCTLLVQRLDLANALDAELHLLKRHLPYFESDHILNLTYNILAGGTTLADIDLLRNDDTWLDALVLAVDGFGSVDNHYTGTVRVSTTDPDTHVVLPPDYRFVPGTVGGGQ